MTSLLPPDEPASPEAARQRALDRYEILDTDPEFAFNDLTQLASLVCQTPISLISLIDRDRQWFKARVGLDVTQTPRDIAFCDHVVRDRAPLEVPDAHLDPRFVANPLVTDSPKLRFYAGVPLRTPDDHYLGTICVLDTVPRHLTDAQKQALHTIAEQVMAQLELKLRNRQLESGYERLTRANHRLDQFTAMVSHDLKTPLSSLLNLTDLMLADARTGDADAVCEALAVMGTEVGRMQKLVGGLLQFARSTRPETQVEEVVVSDLLRELIRTLPGAPGFQFTIGPMPTLRTARIPLRQVFFNLLANAIKYHPTGDGRIEVKSWRGPGRRYWFLVHDDGSGIPAHAHDRVFQLFQRVHDDASHPEGSGVGLATVKHLIEDHGGEITLDSPPGQGTTFSFSWEAAE